jgi:hypothetical protein
MALRILLGNDENGSLWVVGIVGDAMKEFIGFPKIPRLSRQCVITEKIDGTNGVICWDDNMQFMLVGSRTRWITTSDDHFGFARWASDNVEELKKLGPGTHHGEWWGQGIQRGYGLKEKRFSLFNTGKWSDDTTRPACCHVVPVLWTGIFNTDIVVYAMDQLALGGSVAAPGFMNPEGVIVYHRAGNLMFKKTIKNDDVPKGSKETP